MNTDNKKSNEQCAIHSVVDSAEIERQIEMDNEEDNLWQDSFECCNNCDLPDACLDFGCAIDQGLREDDEW